MLEAVLVRPWPWWLAGPAIGLVVTLLAWIGGKALGVSSGYGAVCATVSRLPFFQTRDYTERWRLAFIVGMPIGGLLSAWLAGSLAATTAYGQMDVLTGGSLVLKLGLLVAGGALVGAGARWAGGCTSGHTIVGVAQGAPASIAATLAFMAGGFAVFNVLYALLGGAR